VWGVSTRSLASVADGTLHEHPAGGVDERQSPLSRFLAEPAAADDGVNVALAPLDALAVHLGGASVAGAVGRGGDSDGLQQFFEFGAGAAAWGLPWLYVGSALSADFSERSTAHSAANFARCKAVAVSKVTRQKL